MDSLIARLRKALVPGSGQAAAAGVARSERPKSPVNQIQAARSPAAAEPADGGFQADMLAAPDFPTSILDVAAAPAVALLSAYESRAGLLAAIVYSEALAPPIALR